MTSSKSWQPSSSSKYHHHNHSIFNVCLVIFKSNQISLLFFSLSFRVKIIYQNVKNVFISFFTLDKYEPTTFFFIWKDPYHLFFMFDVKFFVQNIQVFIQVSLCVLSELYLLQTKYFSFQTSITYRSIDLLKTKKKTWI